jgi:hypothetical protein
MADNLLVSKHIHATQDDGRTQVGLSESLNLSELALLCLKEVCHGTARGNRAMIIRKNGAPART